MSVWRGNLAIYVLTLGELACALAGGHWWTCLAVWFANLFIFWPMRILYDMGKPYVYRFAIVGGDGLQRAPWPLGKAKWNLFLHKIVSDDGPIIHSHPWHWATSLILWNKYKETRRQGKTSFPITIEYGPGHLNRIDAETFHTLRLSDPKKPVWTLFLTSKKHGRGWGFVLENGEYVPASNLGANAREEIYRRNALAKPE